MTTHDYPGETNFPIEADATADPGWQRQADQFAATRHQHDAVEPSAVETEATTSAGGHHLDADATSTAQPSSETSLFGSADLEGFRGKWHSVQAGFVDDPKHCVEQADGLVSAVVEQLSSGFADARSRLEQQW